MNHFYAHQWYEKEQKRKEEFQKKQNISLINRNLQRILHQMEGSIHREDYEKEASVVNRMLIQSHIWNMTYANNFENGQVAVEQGLLIYTILMRESLENKTYYLNEVERYMRQLAHVDYNLYLEYGRRKQVISRKEKESANE